MRGRVGTDSEAAWALILGSLEGADVKGRGAIVTDILFCAEELLIGFAEECSFGVRVENTAERKIDFDFGGISEKVGYCLRWRRSGRFRLGMCEFGGSGNFEEEEKNEKEEEEKERKRRRNFR
jgi:hypothetical protein